METLYELAARALVHSINFKNEWDKLCNNIKLEMLPFLVEKVQDKISLIFELERKIKLLETENQLLRQEQTALRRNANTSPITFTPPLLARRPAYIPEWESDSLGELSPSSISRRSMPDLHLDIPYSSSEEYDNL